MTRTAVWYDALKANAAILQLAGSPRQAPFSPHGCLLNKTANTTALNNDNGIVHSNNGENDENNSNIANTNTKSNLQQAISTASSTKHSRRTQPSEKTAVEPIAPP